MTIMLEIKVDDGNLDIPECEALVRGAFPGCAILSTEQQTRWWVTVRIRLE